MLPSANAVFLYTRALSLLLLNLGFQQGQIKTTSRLGAHCKKSSQSNSRREKLPSLYVEKQWVFVLKGLGVFFLV